MSEPSDRIVDRAGWDDLQLLDKHGEDLTEWEIDFVESLTRHLKAGRWLTERQSEVLANIISKRVP